MGRYDSGGYWPDYVPVAERRRRTAKKIASMKKSGRDVSPVEIAGRKIATTFWGEAWCKNLEAYSDYSNRLPRGRTYVRNGSVVDLQVEAGRVRTLVSGRDLYTVDVSIKALPKKKWTAVKSRCAGQIGSLVELLHGSISERVMEIVTRKGEGLFPSPREITLDCSCPDWATMCKHAAATLYAVGARLDREPELLFTLRRVDPTEMVEAAVESPVREAKARKGRVLETDELSSVFGVDIDPTGTAPTARAKRSTRRSGTRKKTVAKTATRKKTATTKTTKTKKSAGKSTSAPRGRGRKSETGASSTEKASRTKRAVKKSTSQKRSVAGKARQKAKR